MSSRQKVYTGLGVYLGLMILTVVIFGFNRIDESPFKPENEFRLDPWIDLGFMSINKAVMYIVIAGILTVGTMVYVANRMQARPNRVQTIVEILFTTMRDTITGANMEQQLAKKWFPFIGTLFLFIWFSNLIGYIPLPTNSEHTFNLFGANIPSFALYAATANLSVPLVLAVIVFIFYTVEGMRAKGFIGYFKGLVPAGTHGPMAVFIWVLEVMSNLMRLISLSVRLFANILAGHLIILFMSGGLAVLLGLEVVGIIALPAGVVLYLFEVGLIATLQAFIFAILAAIYIGGAVAESH